MFLFFLIGVDKWPPVLKKAARLVYIACLSWTFVNFECVGFFPSRGVVYIVLIPENCLSFFLVISMLFFGVG